MWAKGQESFTSRRVAATFTGTTSASERLGACRAGDVRSHHMRRLAGSGCVFLFNFFPWRRVKKTCPFQPPGERALTSPLTCQPAATVALSSLTFIPTRVSTWAPLSKLLASGSPILFSLCSLPLLWESPNHFCCYGGQKLHISQPRGWSPGSLLLPASQLGAQGEVLAAVAQGGMCPACGHSL